MCSDICKAESHLEDVNVFGFTRHVTDVLSKIGERLKVWHQQLLASHLACDAVAHLAMTRRCVGQRAENAKKMGDVVSN